MEIALFVNAALTAIMLSLSHCTFMCGGFAVLLGRLNANIFQIILYHSCRILAYVFLGFIFEFFGTGVMRDASSQGFVYFFCGMLLVVLGIALSAKGKILAFFENNKAQIFIFKLANKVAKRKYIGILGFLNGFFPCGVSYYFLALSFSSGSLAPLIMLIFGICTLPALLFYSFLSKILNEKFRLIAGYISSVIICIYGIYLSYTGFLLI